MHLGALLAFASLEATSTAWDNGAMSSANEFFSSPAWDEKAAAEFDARIRRVPKTSRSRRYYDKAWALFYRSDSDPTRQRAAIALLDRSITEEGTDAREGAYQLLTAARYAVELGDRATAIVLARRSINLSETPSRIGTISAQEVLALCLTDEGDPGARAAWAEFYRYREAFTEGRWRMPAYDELCAREVVDTAGAPVRDPEEAAEGIVVIYHAAEPPEPAVPSVMDGDVAALEALDRHYRHTRRNGERRWAPRRAFKDDYLLGTHLPQLGAYVGRVLVGMGGRWKVETPLMRSRVIVGKKAIDPFRAAYDSIYFETSLADFVRSVTKG
jgi:hypothetical protein